MVVITAVVERKAKLPMSDARTSLLVFFPSKARLESPFHPYREEAVREILHGHLQSDRTIVDGYEISESGGCWYDGNTWHTEANWVVRIYMPVGFVADWADPTNWRTRTKKYVARLARMSCLDMGHAEFFAILHNTQAIRGNREGLLIGPDDALVAYEAILDEA